MTNRTGEDGSNATQRLIIAEQVPLAPMTTLRVGGPARFFAEARSTDALAEGIGWARQRELPLLILGGGSNVVVADGGFPGIVIRVSINGVSTRTNDADVTLTVAAGEDWDSLVGRCVGNGWAGFECLSGIPGRVGATPIQNVGAYGQETSETLIGVEALEIATCRRVTFNREECGFGYRTSRFKTTDRDRFVITGVGYRLEAGGAPAVRYAELADYLAGNGAAHPDLVEVRRAVVDIRRRKAMVTDPNDLETRSVGSFFVNPVVSEKHLVEIEQRAAGLGCDVGAMPRFSAAEGVKLSAAWLIERAGFRRGHSHGGIGISSRHALAIVNRGGGTAAQVIELAREIRTRVCEVFGVTLEPEPAFIGFECDPLSPDNVQG